MPKKPLKWQREYMDWVGGLSHAALLAEVLDAAGGDDYDGCFTSRGSWKYGILVCALTAKLHKGGWLDATGLKEFNDAH